MTTTEGEDQRLVGVTTALYERREDWVAVMPDQSVVFDVEAIAITALQANDAHVQGNPEYCRWECHNHEREEIVQSLNGFWRDTGLPVELLEDLVAVVEERGGPIIETSDYRKGH